MIRFDKTYATSIYSTRFIYIKFSIKDTVEDLTKYRFDLYRANSPTAEDFKLLYMNMLNFEARDYCVSLDNPEIHYFYRIKAIKDTGEEILSDIFTLHDPDGDEYTSYFQDLYDMYLDVIENKELLLLKKKRHGQLCDCYDDIRDSSALGDKCTKCWGVGYVGGYYPPIKIKVNFMNTPTAQEEMLSSGTVETKSSVQLWTTAFPIIQENDILLDSLNNQRSKVMSVRPSWKNGKIIRQTIEMIKIPEGSLIYRMPVDVR